MLLQNTEWLYIRPTHLAPALDGEVGLLILVTGACNLNDWLE